VNIVKRNTEMREFLKWLCSFYKSLNISFVDIIAADLQSVIIIVSYNPR